MITVLHSSGHNGSHPGPDALIGRRISHVQHLLVESGFFWASIVHEEHAVFNGHEPVPSAVDKKQPATWSVHYPIFNQTIVLLCFFQEFFPILIAVFGDVSFAKDEGIFMVINVLQPLSGQKQVRSSTLPDTASQARVMGVRNPNGIVSSSRETPNNACLHVKLRLPIHPVQDGGKQSIWGLWIAAVCRTICSAWDLGDDRAPTSCYEIICPLAQVVSHVLPVYKQSLRLCYLAGDRRGP